jgi:hypothetical protein
MRMLIFRMLIGRVLVGGILRLAIERSGRTE